MIRWSSCYFNYFLSSKNYKNIPKYILGYEEFRKICGTMIIEKNKQFTVLHDFVYLITISMYTVKYFSNFFLMLQKNIFIAGILW